MMLSHEFECCISSISSMDDEGKVIFLSKLPLSNPPVFLIPYLLLSLLRERLYIDRLSPSLRPIEIVEIKTTLTYSYYQITVFVNECFEFFQPLLIENDILSCLRMMSYCGIKNSWKSFCEIDSFFRCLNIAPYLYSSSYICISHMLNNLPNTRFESLPIAMSMGVDNHYSIV